MNCMCPAPDYADYIIPANKLWQSPRKEVTTHFDDNVLHGKKADRFCERCGRGLCGDCAVSATEGYIDIPNNKLVTFKTEPLCQACKEDLK